MSDTIHLCPVGDSATTPCGVYPMERMRERITLKPELATCVGCLRAAFATAKAEGLEDAADMNDEEAERLAQLGSAGVGAAAALKLAAAHHRAAAAKAREVGRGKP